MRVAGQGGGRGAGRGQGGGVQEGLSQAAGPSEGRGGGVQEGFSQVAGPSRGRGGGRGARQAGRGRGGDQVIPGVRGGDVAAAAGRGRGRGGGGVGAGRGVRARKWCFTINNYRGVPEELPRGPPPVVYLCYGKEVSSTGTPHLQGYVCFKNAVYRPSRFFQQYGNGHFSMARGSADQNIEYCSKEGDFTEFGTRPQGRDAQGHHGRRGGELEIERWEEAWSSAKAGKVEDIPADIRLRHYTTICKVAAKYKKRPARLAGLDNTWIVGPHGTGKSTYVHDKYPGAYKKGFSKWWCGFNEDDEGHLTVLLDDLHPKWAEKELLKNWADVFPFVAEYKGGSMQIRPARIVVTSNFTIEQVCFVLFLKAKEKILMNMSKTMRK